MSDADQDGAAGRFVVIEVIRPAALLSEMATRQILAGLEAQDVEAGGHWRTRPGIWQRFEGPTTAQPGADPGTGDVGAPGADPSTGHVGTISCVYDSPRRYTVTVFRASLTAYGAGLGWSVESLCDDAFRHAGITLASCPRVPLIPPPAPYREP